MKRNFIVVLILFAVSTAVFAQRIPVVGILPFEAASKSVTPAELEKVTSQVVSELSSWGTLRIVQGSDEAEYIVSGTLARQGSSFIVTAVTVDAKTKQTMNETKEQPASLEGFQVLSFCTKVVEKVPFPNYMLGTWQSTINMPDGPVVCIIEFKSDRTVKVERYDTWEHKQRNALRYEGYGTGTYAYAGYARRVMTVNSRQIQVDATVSVNLNLEETLPEQTMVSQSGLRVLFNSDKNTFEFVSGSLPCGRNFDGASVYPSATIAFTQFTKIR